MDNTPAPHSVLKKLYVMIALCLLAFDAYILHKQVIKIQEGLGIPTHYKIITLEHNPTEFWIIVLIIGVLGATLLSRGMKIERPNGY